MCDSASLEGRRSHVCKLRVLSYLVTTFMRLSAGIHESSSVFSRFGALHDDDETQRDEVRSADKEMVVEMSSSGKGGGSSGNVKQADSSTNARKKSGGKKNRAQQERTTFDECVREVGSHQHRPLYMSLCVYVLCVWLGLSQVLYSYLRFSGL